MTEPNARRGFLRGLLSLPLIGGGVSLIGAPSAVAEPVTPELMRAYVGWLAREHGRAHDQYIGMLSGAERYANPALARITQPIAPIAGHAICNWPAVSNPLWHETGPNPATRAALVLSTVGVEWRP